MGVGGYQTAMKPNVVLKGSLSFLNLGELLQFLGGSGSTGVLRLSSIYAKVPGYIYLVDGNPIHADYGEIKGMEAFNLFFGWMDGQFEFSSEPVACDKTIRKSRMELILDGLRMVDEGKIEKLGRASASSQFHLTSTASSDIPVIKGPLVDYVYVVDEEEFEGGKEIVVQEKYGNWLWVILQGTVEVVRILPEGYAPINRLTDGAFIGGVGALFPKGNVRSATVRAISRVQLGVLDFERIFREYTAASDDFKRVLMSLDSRLKQVTTHCAEAILKKNEGKADLSDLKLFPVSNTPDDRVHRIRAGRAVIVRQDNKHPIMLCTLGPGDILGDIPFLGTAHEPHSASVYVSKDFETDEINLTDIKQEYDDGSETFRNLILHTATCLSVTTARLMGVLKQKTAE